jgi:hypothetical protein
MFRVAILGLAVAVILLDTGNETFAGCACGPHSHLASVTYTNGAPFCWCPCNKGYVSAGPPVYALQAVSRGCVARKSGADREAANSNRREAANSTKQTQVSKQSVTANADNGPAFCDPSGKCTPAPSVAPPTPPSQSGSSSCGGLSVGPGATAIPEESCNPGNAIAGAQGGAAEGPSPSPVGQNQPPPRAPSLPAWMELGQAFVGDTAEAQSTTSNPNTKPTKCVAQNDEGITVPVDCSKPGAHPVTTDPTAESVDEVIAKQIKAEDQAQQGQSADSSGASNTLQPAAGSADSKVGSVSVPLSTDQLAAIIKQCSAPKKCSCNDFKLESVPTLMDRDPCDQYADMTDPEAKRCVVALAAYRPTAANYNDLAKKACN